MRLVIDIEANGLKPTKIWVVVCKDYDTGQLHVFRNVTEDKRERAKLLSLLDFADVIIGHHILGYDIPVLVNLIGLDIAKIFPKCVDTLIISKLVDYS
jgi:DNA polymerase-1